jgi:hypothetical protein
LDTTSQIRSCDDGATKVEKFLLGNSHISIEMSLYVGPERVGHKREIVVEVGRVYEL